MRLSLAGYYPSDGRYRLITSGRKLTGQCNDVFYFILGRPYYDELKIGIVQLQLKQYEIFCTPRCHETGGWEVGIHEGYYVKYLCGSKSPTTLDINILQIFGQVLTFVQAVMVEQRSGSVFCVRVGLGVNKRRVDRSFLSRSVSEVAMSNIGECDIQVRKLLAGRLLYPEIKRLFYAITQIRDCYYDDLHLNPILRRDSANNHFYRALGKLYGRICSYRKKHELIVRQYLMGHPNIKEVRHSKKGVLCSKNSEEQNFQVDNQLYGGSHQIALYTSISKEPGMKSRVYNLRSRKSNLSYLTNQIFGVLF